MREEWKEIIEGVIAVHTGRCVPFLNKKGEIEEREMIDFYDAAGNRFYSNFESLKEAQEAIKRLANEGTIATIGPKAPWRQPSDGKLIHNGNEKAVGVYIVRG